MVQLRQDLAPHLPMLLALRLSLLRSLAERPSMLRSSSVACCLPAAGWATSNRSAIQEGEDEAQRWATNVMHGLLNLASDASEGISDRLRIGQRSCMHEEPVPITNMYY